MPRLAIAFALLLAATPLLAQRVDITIDAAHPTGPYRPIWQYFGADEPNYTYTLNGTHLLAELARIDPATPVRFRPHNLLTSGDGSASLKWGSTGVYTENPDGTPHYDWRITDQLFDNLVAQHIRPLVEIGFMPEALSPHPTPYRHAFPQGNIFTGWSYPPNDYGKWRALIVAWTRHLAQRYGAQVDTWQWEVWNEPDITYFHGTPEEYFKLYDITTAAVRQALPHAFVGGPAVTSGGQPKHFLQLFLEHCAHGVNADTGKPGVPLDFISFHSKGQPKFLAADATTPAHVRMNLGRQLSQTDAGFQTVASFPEYKPLPILLTETDPEGCAACTGPQNAYRNGTLYSVSVAEMLVRSAELARLRGVNLAGAITWAFEFENQPPFAGFRSLATTTPSGLVDKPILNVFRLFAKLGSEFDSLDSGSTGSQNRLAPRTQEVSLTSTAALPLTTIAQPASVSAQPDITGIATRTPHSLTILLFHYHDDDLPAPGATLTLHLLGLPAQPIHVTRSVIDRNHANAYTAWQKMGSPQSPTPVQVAQLRAAAELHPTAPSPPPSPARPCSSTASPGSYSQWSNAISAVR